MSDIEIGITTKTCRDCGVEKSSTDFAPKGKGRVGLRSETRTNQEPPYARARGTDQEAPAEPRRLQPSANVGGSRWASVYPTCAFFVWPLVGPSVPPEALEAIRREGGVAHGRGDRRWPRVVLNCARGVARSD